MENTMEMPVLKFNMKYSDGSESVRSYQGGQLVDVVWVRKPILIKSSDIISSTDNNATGKL
jgi:hypothetical protein